MPVATLTSKGQITIPKPIRAALGLRRGDRVTFRLLEDGSVEMRPRCDDLLSLYGKFRTDIQGVTVEDMEEGIARGATGVDEGGER